MKKIFLIVLIVFMSYSTCIGCWTKVDTERQICFLTTMLIDWQQTLDIEKDSTMWEKNSILGKHPSREKINNYFLITAVGHTLISYTLPEDYRKIWQLIWIGIQSNQIMENDNIGLEQHNIGIKYRFKYIINF